LFTPFAVATRDYNMTMDLKALLNGLFALFSDNATCISTWGIYFVDEKFDDEPELRNKLGIIWLASLFDSLEGELRVLEKYRAAATELNQPVLVELCTKAREFMNTVREVLGLYSREEQLFVRDLRDQWVHSWLARRHNESFDIKFYDGTRVVRENVTRDSYYAAIRPFFDNPDGIDSVITSLLERATKGQLRYWNAIDLLIKQMPLLHQVIMEGLDTEIQ